MAKEWWERLSQKEAYDKLTELIDKKGALKIITAQHNCDCNKDGRDPRNEREFKTCSEYKYLVEDPRHFVLHDVVHISDINKDTGRCIAYSEEGDSERAYPNYLLYRLTLHNESKEEFDNLYETMKR